jgi:hypothetical protein
MSPSPLAICVAISRELYFTFAKSNEVCISVVNKVSCCSNAENTVYVHYFSVI